MKIEATKVVEFLDQVKALVEDINLTIRMGDDGMEDTVNYQVASITKAIEVFKLEQLSSVTPIDPAQKRYSRIYDELVDKQDKTTHEATQLYKSQLYFALKRVIAKCPDIAEVKNKDLCNFIEGSLPDDSVYRRLIYSEGYFYISLAVIQEVADEIIEQRAKAPQTKLF